MSMKEIKNFLESLADNCHFSPLKKVSINKIEDWDKPKPKSLKY